jgi:hypothetical protein
MALPPVHETNVPVGKVREKRLDIIREGEEP